MAEVVKQQGEPVAAEELSSVAERRDAPGATAGAQAGEAQKTGPAPAGEAQQQEPAEGLQAQGAPESKAVPAASAGSSARKPSPAKKPSSAKAASAGARQSAAKPAPAEKTEEAKPSGKCASAPAGASSAQKAPCAGKASGHSGVVAGSAAKEPAKAAPAATKAPAKARKESSASKAAAPAPAAADTGNPPSGDDVLAEALRHGAHVAGLAGSLFDQLQDLHGLDADWRRRLLGAARLHDIGFVAGRKGHHKASMRRILEDPSLELLPDDRSLIALLARYHRKAWPSGRHSQFAVLPRATRKALRRAAALLRVADGLDYTHQALVTGITVRMKSRRVVLVLRSKSECQQEMKRAVRKGDLFAHVFGLQVECACQPD
ncbi:MAG TPA: HD domain-containing protein [Candidatus Avidesulfovibrio excrementigallinarum]|nr:HD domain-containing protein [Candidatus Avidesulfovibrio excrementigallinarum]